MSIALLRGAGGGVVGRVVSAIVNTEGGLIPWAQAYKNVLTTENVTA